MILEFLELEVGDCKVPYAQYMMNENQIINVIPLSAEIAAQVECEGFVTWHWGRLSSLNFIMEFQTRNSLANDGWDFEKYPDPEIVIMSRKGELKSILSHLTEQS